MASCAPPPPPEQREAIYNDFQTSSNSFPADSHHTLDRETPPTQHPAAAQAARWWPKTSSEQHSETLRFNPKQPVRGATSEGCRRQRASNRACSGSVIVGSNLESLKCSSTFMASRCPHDEVGPQYDLVKATDGLRFPIQTTMEVRRPRHQCQSSLHVFKTCDWCEPAHFPNNSRCDNGVARFDHRQTISPTGFASPKCAPDAQPSQTEI